MIEAVTDEGGVQLAEELQHLAGVAAAKTPLKYAVRNTNSWARGRRNAAAGSEGAAGDTLHVTDTAVPEVKRVPERCHIAHIKQPHNTHLPNERASSVSSSPRPYLHGD